MWVALGTGNVEVAEGATALLGIRLPDGEIARLSCLYALSDYERSNICLPTAMVTLSRGMF